jgi:hypothetical protein
MSEEAPVEFDRIEHDPLIYLQPPPTDREEVAADKIRTHVGGSVPVWMVLRIADRLYQQSIWAKRIDSSRHAFRRRIRRVIAFFAANAVAAILAASSAWLHAHDARIAAEQRAEASERAFEEYRRGIAKDIERLEKEIDQVRAVLLRATGIDIPAPRPSGPGSPSSDMPDPFDKYTLRDAKESDLCSRFEP